jgi:hypothetical protein
MDHNREILPDSELKDYVVMGTRDFLPVLNCGLELLWLWNR